MFYGEFDVWMYGIEIVQGMLYSEKNFGTQNKYNVIYNNVYSYQLRSGRDSGDLIMMQGV